jgi:hypothetical protein
MVEVIASHNSDGEMRPVRIPSAHFIAVVFIFFACCLMLPSGAKSTPSVVSACDTSNRLISFLWPRMSLTKRDPGQS